MDGPTHAGRSRAVPDAAADRAAPVGARQIVTPGSDQRSDSDRQQLWRLLLNYADPDDSPTSGLTSRQRTNMTEALETMDEIERMRMHQAFMQLVANIVTDVAHLLCTAPVQLEPDSEDHGDDHEMREEEEPEHDQPQEEDEDEESALVQLTLERAGRPDAFGRQLETLVDKLATMSSREAGAHAQALLQSPPCPTSGMSSDAWRRPSSPMRTTAGRLRTLAS